MERAWIKNHISQFLNDTKSVFRFFYAFFLGFLLFANSACIAPDVERVAADSSSIIAAKSKAKYYVQVVQEAEKLSHQSQDCAVYCWDEISCRNYCQVTIGSNAICCGLGAHLSMLAAGSAKRKSKRPR